ncbi:MULTISPECIES: hypothetical protein [Acetobacter]|uniref:hypothetical protein n=1 Tax=Acetobacter TaxID=434 RepID=UPI001BABCE7C|nr:MULTISPECIES: hypothetical protein [Acetobacter]MBS0962403.1 hypothetical protein [Acetobacter persici]MBS0999863.1 hypothetical protein [Acetobacter persici]MBS1014745.1 hypothetical protein [Acetobacter persici]
MTLLCRLAAISALLMAPAVAHAQAADDGLPETGSKNPYSPLDVPTKLAPESRSLSDLLTDGYAITTASHVAKGEIFTLRKDRKTILCVLTAPFTQSDQNVPTSRCWALN